MHLHIFRANTVRTHTDNLANRLRINIAGADRCHFADFRFGVTAEGEFGAFQLLLREHCEHIALVFGDVGSLVLRERKLLSEDGVIVVSAVIDSATGYNLCLPEIHSRGFVFVKESTELFEDAQELVIRILDKYADSRKRDLNALKNKIKDEVLKLMHERTKRSPIVIPVIQEI